MGCGVCQGRLICILLGMRLVHIVVWTARIRNLILCLIKAVRVLYYLFFFEVDALIRHFYRCCRSHNFNIILKHTYASTLLREHIFPLVWRRIGDASVFWIDGFDWASQDFRTLRGLKMAVTCKVWTTLVHVLVNIELPIIIKFSRSNMHFISMESICRLLRYFLANVDSRMWVIIHVDIIVELTITFHRILGALF